MNNIYARKKKRETVSNKFILFSMRWRMLIPFSLPYSLVRLQSKEYFF